MIIGLTAREDEALVPAVFARWPGAHVMTVTPTGTDVVVLPADAETRRACADVAGRNRLSIARSVLRAVGFGKGDARRKRF